VIDGDSKNRDCDEVMRAGCGEPGVDFVTTCCISIEAALWLTMSIATQAIDVVGCSWHWRIW